MKVPFINFKLEWDFFEKDFVKSFKDFGKMGWYVLGPEVENFEKDFAIYCNYKYAVGVSTGLSALEISLRAYDIGNGDEVITVANTAVASSLSISNVGAKPIFCDVGDDFLIDTNKIESLITEKTKAILPIHLFGKVCNMENINKIAEENGLLVIEDACQAHGANFSGSSAHNTKAFSFYPTKNLGALGEGGAIVTNDEKIKDFALSYRNYGQSGRYNHIIKGINSRIDALQCVFLNIKLKKMVDFISKRHLIAQRYVDTLKNIEGLIINDFDVNSSYHLFVIRVLDNKRDLLKKFLEEKGIDSLIHYPTMIHHQPCYKDEYRNLVLNNTDKFQNEILSLPCYPFLTNEELDYVIKSVQDFFCKK